MAPSRYDWKIVDWDVKPQHNQITWAFAGRRCDKYHNFMSWLIVLWVYFDEKFQC